MFKRRQADRAGLGLDETKSLQLRTSVSQQDLQAIHALFYTFTLYYFLEVIISMWLLPRIKKDFLCPKLNSLEFLVILCAFQIGGPSPASWDGWEQVL